MKAINRLDLKIKYFIQLKSTGPCLKCIYVSKYDLTNSLTKQNLTVGNCIKIFFI